MTRRYHIAVWLTAAFLTAYMAWAFHTAVTTPIVPVESSHKAEEDLWPETPKRQVALPMWEQMTDPAAMQELRKMMARNDI